MILRSLLIEATPYLCDSRLFEKTYGSNRVACVQQFESRCCVLEEMGSALSYTLRKNIEYIYEVYMKVCRLGVREGIGSGITLHLRIQYSVLVS